MRRFALALLLLAAGPALAQDPAAQARLDRAAKTHEAASWPRSAAVDGVAATTFEPGQGLTADGPARVDARRGELSRAFKAGADDAGLVVSVRLHASVDEARAQLLAGLVACTGGLERAPALGDAAFVARDRAGRAPLVLGLRGNVTFSVRDLAALEGAKVEGADDGRAERVAAALDRLIAASPALAPGAAPAGPRLLGLKAGAAREGLRPLALDVDPTSPEAAFLVFVCSGDASVVDVPGGWALLAPTSGPVTIEVFACSKWLQRAASSHVVVVTD